MPLRIVIVQSEKRVTQMLTRYLSQRGDEVWQAWDLGQAAALVEQVKPHLIFMDLHYPGEGWQRFLRQMRKQYPEVQFIANNRYPDLQRELIAREIGVNVFLREPFTRQWVDRAIERTGLADEPAILAAAPLPRVRVPVRIKITTPYLLLVIFFALVSAYLVNQLLLESARTRFLSQLSDSGQRSADWMVGEETRCLTTLRLMSNTQGVAEAVSRRDARTLRALLLPLAVNTGEESVQVLDLQGAALLSMQHVPNGGRLEYAFSTGDIRLQPYGFVQSVLRAQVDAAGRDKYAGLVSLDGQDTYFYIAGPILDEDNRVVGALLVGQTVQTLVRQMKRDLLVDVSLYNLAGRPLASTLPAVQPIDSQRAAQVVAGQNENSLTRQDADYTELLGVWEARGSEDLGLMGTSLTQVPLNQLSPLVGLQLFAFIALGIALIVVIGVWLANLITRPLVRLLEASAEVAQGNLEVKVDAEGNDELAVLAQSFNRMVAGLQEGSIYRDLLGRTVSPEVREQLRQEFYSGDLRLEGQDAVATVLITDIRSFTTLSEHLNPAMVFNWLNEYFGQIVPMVTVRSGVVNQFDGDAMLAFFGILPGRLPPRDSARVACEAGLAILAAVNQLNQRRVERGEPPLVTGIGIHTGPVRAGGLGASDRVHYTIIGDTVNTAQRLQMLTRALLPSEGILISHATYQALEEDACRFELAVMGEHALKGKADALTVYHLLPSPVPCPEKEA